MVPLRHPLSNGDVVEILTQKGHSPSRDWLSFVRTSHARSKIRQWINLNERKQATEVGRRLVEREARQLDVSLKKISDEDLLRVASRIRPLEDRRSVRRFGLWQVFRAPGAREADRADRRGKAAKAESEPAPIVSKVKRMLGIRDPGILVLRPGRPDGLSREVLQSDSGRSDRRIRHAWPRRRRAHHFLPQRAEPAVSIRTAHRRAVERCGAGDTYPVTLMIHAKDRPGLLADITSVISAVGANIQSLESRPDNLQARIDATVEITDRDQLERILRNIKRISGVFGIERVYRA